MLAYLTPTLFIIYLAQNETNCKDLQLLSDSSMLSPPAESNLICLHHHTTHSCTTTQNYSPPTNPTTNLQHEAAAGILNVSCTHR